ncbi:hypothetical protein SAMN05216266_11713 [Amycolatopsis marina]|uniref:Uncharacterized protein n=1 Tax=Amycolatopsis marina TaxID=490629 RepID=A0A1I1BXC2_9PSEU|nr:hypothetical protein [Amycolatopsis marina]SFB53298.1 hypothetical protein SAMN05216266_11713 [Amycolatopsis marina]
MTNSAWLELPAAGGLADRRGHQHAAAHTDPKWQAVRCAPAVRPASRKIQLTFYGLSEPAEHRDSSVEDQRVLDDMRRLADQHNWNQGHGHRFVLITHVVTDHSAPALLALGDRPGTTITES